MRKWTAIPLISMLLGGCGGTGTEPSPTPTPPGQPARMLGDGAGVLMGDVNGDGKADLVGIGAASDPDAGVVYVGLSNGSGFPRWTWKSVGRMLGTGATVLLGDVDGDGRADLVGIGAPSDADAGVVYVGLSSGSGFPGWTWRSPSKVIGVGAKVLLGDVSGDGKADLVGIGGPQDLDAGVVYVGKSDGNGFPGWTWKTTGRMLSDTSRVLLADVDGDRIADLVGVGGAADADAGIVYVGKSDGSGFPAWTWKTTGRMLSDTAQVLLADVSGDGTADLVGVGGGVDLDAGVVYVATSNGNGFPAWTWNSGKRRLSNEARAFLGDVTGDRRADLIGVGGPHDPDAGVIYMGPSQGNEFSAWTWWSSR